MTAPRHVGVIDIGKTNVKFAIVDLERGRETVVGRTRTPVRDGPPYRHFDTDAIWQFLCETISTRPAERIIDALSVTTHGASAALVDAEGKLTLPVLDYEDEGPDAIDAEYAEVRPPFRESYSPPLPGGLNLGKQIFWLSRREPDSFARTRWILTLPQYWSYRLSGVAASELTSLGCHTDLWSFPQNRLSSFVYGQGWLEKFPPLRKAADHLGPVRPEVAQMLGLDPATPVLCGIHDSNASLLPHLLTRRPPFSVVSTGTWVIVCSPGGKLEGLDPQRDCLANIDALGHPVPSARFMGGREYSVATKDVARAVSSEVLEKVLRERLFLLPSLVRGSGPFPESAARWTYARSVEDPITDYAVVSCYLALMTAECLRLSGASADVVVEGPFAANPIYLSMLKAVTGRPVFAQTDAATGTATGAALLATYPAVPRSLPHAAEVSLQRPELFRHYADDWRTLVIAGECSAGRSLPTNEP